MGYDNKGTTEPSVAFIYNLSVTVRTRNTWTLKLTLREFEVGIRTVDQVSLSYEHWNWKGIHEMMQTLSTV